MEKLNLCVVGAAGRLGLCVLKSLLQPEFADKINLVGAIVSNQSGYKNRPVVSEIGLKSSLVFSDDLSAYIKQADVILDCSSPESSMQTLALAKSAHKKLILCATGFTATQLDNIKQTAQVIPIVFAPNTSIGLNLTNAVTKLLCTKIPGNTDIQIIETHHVHKKDAPSGAAKQLANTVNAFTDSQPVITSMRIGETIGEHTVLFTLNGEQIQLTHKAFDRSIFALGALRAATWLNRVIQPAFYTMDDVLLLND
jgi:4-hydroxy-tetrahydrodipicolinate reductase